MRYARGTASRRRYSGSGQDFWLSFSDLMSVLVLVFILILFYILYKYVIISGSYNAKRTEMAIVEAALNEKQAALVIAQDDLAAQQGELDDAKSNLAIAQGDLTSAQNELTSAQEELARQQLLLNLAQQAMDESESALSTKQSELDAALASLSERESSIAELSGQLDQKQQQLEALVGVRTQIIQALSKALKDNNVKATVDPSNGSIELQSDVLFEYGSSALSSTGKAYIDDFLPVYLSVLLSPENASYVSEIIIEGHTDTVDTYLKNLKLSQERAYAVAGYVLSDGNNALTSSQRASLKDLLTANGRSFSDPVYDDSGYVDAAASRRVVFKFRLSDEQMIEQMRDILENVN